MWPFAKTTLDTPPELASADPAESAADREQAALEAVRQLKAELSELDRAILHFKGAYKVRTDRFSRLLSIECPGVNGFEKVQTEWRVLLRNRDSLVPRWHAALKHLAEAKQAAKEKNEKSEH
jgi:hypothetical protein